MSDINISYRQYWNEINSIVDETFQEAREHQTIPIEHLHETIDGHQWVIYTAYAFDVLKHSDNGDYSAEQFGAESLVKDGQTNWAVMVYGAMYGDCMDRTLLEWQDWNEIPEAQEEAKRVQIRDLGDSAFHPSSTPTEEAALSANLEAVAGPPDVQAMDFASEPVPLTEGFIDRVVDGLPSDDPADVSDQADTVDPSEPVE